MISLTRLSIMQVKRSIVHFFKYNQLYVFFLSTDNGNIWSIEVNLPSNKEIRYRYTICSIDPQTEEIHVRQWETHIEPRCVPYNNEESLELQRVEDNKVDVYGDINGEIKLDRGWLTSETLVQFKFFNNPFMLKERIKNKLLYVKVIHFEISL